ncbi:unnamed protein product, partial [Ectocarpus sp. 4 AP-2014]
AVTTTAARDIDTGTGLRACYGTARLLSGRKPASRHRTRRRHGRRSNNREYLLRKAGTPRSRRSGLVDIRAGVDEGGGTRKSGRNRKPKDKEGNGSTVGNLTRDHAYWHKWYDDLWHKYRDNLNYTWEDYKNGIEENQEITEEAREKYEAELKHDNWLELVAGWESNVKSGKTWWTEDYLKEEIERTKELRDTVREQEEAERRESDAAGDEVECTNCGATVVCDAGVTTEDQQCSGKDRG